LRKLIDISFDENGAETAETHDFRTCFDSAGRRAPYTSKVVVHGNVAEAVRRYEGINVNTARRHATRRGDLDMTDGARWNPRQDAAYFLFRQWGMPGSAQDCEYVRSRSPTFLMTDEGEIDFVYTGN
jgi:hypothetical protein